MIPAGMIEVSRDAFFDALYADKRDIMPRATIEADGKGIYSVWSVVATRESWGWSTDARLGGGGVYHRKVYALKRS